jgi:hypothetical protein
MPKLSNHKKDEIYKNIMGSGTETGQTAEENITPSSNISKKPDSKLSNKTENNLDELVHKSYYITKRHVKALKMRTAISDKPEEKDFSAIVRAALDLYFAT